MQIRTPVLAGITTLAVAVPTAAIANGSHSVSPVAKQHSAAIAACSAHQLLAGYTSHPKLFLPNGVAVSGRPALLALFEKIVKLPKQGGLCGMKITPTSQYQRGSTLVVTYKATAPFFTKPYYETDAYLLSGGKIAVETTTFNGADLPVAK